MKDARNGTNGRHRATTRRKNTVDPATLVIRPVRKSDLVPLRFFYDTVLRRDYFMRRRQLEEIIGGQYHQVFVAELDGVLVGVAITTCGSRLVNALVHPAYRGIGIGKKLVQRSGATEVRAKLDMSTGDPRGFYRSMGFEATGVRNGKGNIQLMSLKSHSTDDNGRNTPRKRASTNGKRTRKNGNVATRATAGK